MDKTLEKCSMCMGYHSNLDCIYKNDNIKNDKNDTIKNDTIKNDTIKNVKNDIKKEAKCSKCSKCGGIHFDLSCIYSKNESLLG
jgi:hypothetical protein